MKETHLKNIENAKFGIETRVPIHYLLQRSYDINKSSIGNMISINTNLMEFIRSSTTLDEVITARDDYQTLGDRIDYIESIFLELEKLIGFEGELPENQTSSVTYNIID